MLLGLEPFEDRGADESLYGADITVAIRDTLLEEDTACGVAYLSVLGNLHEKRYNVATVTDWPVSNPGSVYCPDDTFAHEVGHILGAVHDRENASGAGAYSFSYGHQEEGVFKTIMSYATDPDIYLFSNPDLNCAGYPCGVPADDDAAADVSRTFRTTGPLVSSHAGEYFSPDAIESLRWVRESDCGEELEEGSELGETRAIIS